MIRFVLKSAFFLGLVALVVPSLTGRSQDDGAPGAGVDLFSTLGGAQAAISDLSGFCGRAPSACAAGGDLARFAAERIGDGLQVAYGFIDSSSGGNSALDQRFAGIEAKAGRTDPAFAAAAVRARAALGHDAMSRDAMATGAVTEALSRDRPTIAAAAQAASRNGFAMPAVAVVRLGPPSPKASIPPLRAASRLPIPSPAPRA